MGSKKYDVFISYAVEDRISIVTDLVKKLEEAGIKVWYAKKEFRAGFGIEETIKQGLEQSRLGVVVLSHNYFDGHWPTQELYALWAKGAHVLPIWHEITEEEIRAINPNLVDKWAFISNDGFDQMTNNLIEQIRVGVAKDKEARIKPIKLRAKLAIIALLVVGVLMLGFYHYFKIDPPTASFVNSSIEERINDFQTKLIHDHKLEMNEVSAEPVDVEEVEKYYKKYDDIGSSFDNDYTFKNGHNTIQHRRNVEAALSLKLKLLSPYNDYGFDSTNIYILKERDVSKNMDIKYIFLNPLAATYKIEEEGFTEDFKYRVTVSYTQNIRCLSVRLLYNPDNYYKKMKKTYLLGFLPEETYLFEKIGDEWVLEGLDDPY